MSGLFYHWENRDPKNKENDPRNELYLHYLKFIKEFEPELFVFENVPGIISAKNGNILSDLKEKIDRLNYRVEAKVLNALNLVCSKTEIGLFS